jgi:anthranilate/para-aminobenzoate synthase component II
MLIVVDNTHTQRVKMFFPKLIEYLKKHCLQYTIVNGNKEGIDDIIKILSTCKVRGIILSGSPLMLPSAQRDDYVTNMYCLSHLKHIPTLGICFGCELINVSYGGSLHDFKKVKCEKYNVSPINLKAKFCCRYIPNKVGKNLTERMHVSIEGMSFPCVIEHKKYPLIGMMFHPEALKSTHFFLDKYINLCGIKTI